MSSSKRRQPGAGSRSKKARLEVFEVAEPNGSRERDTTPTVLVDHVDYHIDSTGKVGQQSGRHEVRLDPLEEAAQQDDAPPTSADATVESIMEAFPFEQAEGLVEPQNPDSAAANKKKRPRPDLRAAVSSRSCTSVEWRPTLLL